MCVLVVVRDVVIVMIVGIIVLDAGGRRLGVRLPPFAAWRGAFVDDKLGGRDAGTKHTCGGDFHARQRQAAKRALQLVERQPGIEKGAERHIA